MSSPIGITRDPLRKRDCGPENVGIAATVESAWRANTRRAKGRGPAGRRSYVWASGWRRCHRAMDLDLLAPEDRTFDEDALERFRGGDDFERSVRAHLLHAGELANPSWTLTSGQEHFEIRDAGGRVIMTGRMEGELFFDQTSEYVPFEIKGGQAVRAVESLGDFARSRWTRGYPYQLLAYMHAKGRDRGLFILWRPALPKFIEIRMGTQEKAMLADFLRRCEESADVAEGKRELHPFPDDLRDCRQCDHFGKSCAPPLEHGEGLVRLDDPTLIEAAEAEVADYEAAKRYERAHELLKKSLRGRPLVMLGDRFEVRGQYGSHTSYKVPDEVKQQYKEVDPEGRWSFEVTPLAGVEV